MCSFYETTFSTQVLTKKRLMMQFFKNDDLSTRTSEKGTDGEIFSYKWRTVELSKFDDSLQHIEFSTKRFSFVTLVENRS